MSEKNGRYFKYFYGDNCPNCKRSEKLIERLEKDGLHIEKYNARSETDADDVAEAYMYMVQSIPTLILFDKHDEIVCKWVGDINPNDVLRL